MRLIGLHAGPLEQRSMNGFAMHYRVASYLWKDLDGYEVPLNYLKKKIERGELGLEAGKGYYDWRGVDPVAVRREKDEALIKGLGKHWLGGKVKLKCSILSRWSTCKRRKLAG